jgi:FkbH-like protein
MLLINASITKDLNKILNLEIFNRRNNEVISNTDRSNDIIANQKRRNILENSLNEESSLLSIGTELMSKFASTKEELQRAEELFQKTNQFNFSNKRSKIQKMTKTNASKVIITKLSDSFSDSGIIASMMYDSKKNEPIVIKEFVISCRALGRGLEKYILKSMLALISRQKIKKIGNEIFFDWNETDRNIPAQKFIEDIGMIDNLTPKKLLLEPSKLAINDLFDKVIND